MPTIDQSNGAGLPSPTGPTVFISYSHDNDTHKAWVKALCLRLRAAGIGAYCDQAPSALRLGSDLSLFMDRARHADRWLCICTPTYVQKVNDGVGGAGYERMTIARELMTSIDTDKFIPVVRVLAEGVRWVSAVPHLLGTRVGLDLRDGSSFDQNIQALIDDLRQASPATSPTNSTPAPPQPPAVRVADQVLVDVAAMTPAGFVTQSPAMMRRWRLAGLSALKVIADRQGQAGLATADQAENAIRQGINAIEAWLMGILYDGTPGGNPLTPPGDELVELMYPTAWGPSRSSVHRDLPKALVFFAHVWLGAARIKNGKFRSAIDFAAAPLHDPTIAEHHIRLAFDTEYLGLLRLYPRRTSPIHASFLMLMNGFTTWPWLAHLFDGERDYQVMVNAYLLALHLNEFANAASLCSRGEADPGRLSRGEWTLSVPPLFTRDDDGLVEEAFRRLRRRPGDIEWIFERNNVGLPYMAQFWPGWKRAVNTWLSSQNYAPFASLPYGNLLGDRDG